LLPILGALEKVRTETGSTERQSKVEGSDLVYTYKLIDGTMPKSGGATSLFIDWIGVGGGVGRGFHGVGVGRRGPGIR